MSRSLGVSSMASPSTGFTRSQRWPIVQRPTPPGPLVIHCYALYARSASECPGNRTVARDSLRLGLAAPKARRGSAGSRGRPRAGTLDEMRATFVRIQELHGAVVLDMNVVSQTHVIGEIP